MKVLILFIALLSISWQTFAQELPLSSIASQTFAQERKRTIIESVAIIASDKIESIIPKGSATPNTCVISYSYDMRTNPFGTAIYVGVRVLKDGVILDYPIYQERADSKRADSNRDRIDFENRWPAHRKAIVARFADRTCSSFEKAKHSFAKIPLNPGDSDSVSRRR